MYCASFAPFPIRSKEIVDEIAFSRVSILEATNRVQRETNNTEENKFKSSWPIKLRVGLSRPLPAPTSPATPISKIVKNAPIAEMTDAFFIVFSFFAEKVLCQYPWENISAAVTANITASADFKLNVSKVPSPPNFE